MNKTDYDLCIIGGGINGTGIARDAAGRGLSVVLLEQGDLGGATSSASTKLIHGGLRYLEYFEFSLVRHALQEREVLLGIAPHIITPLRFILPHEPHLRPAWMIRSGLFLYDHLARRKTLGPSRAVRLEGGPLADHYKTGFSYADCWVDDARLVILNALDAKERGAEIKPHTACTNITPHHDHWEISYDSGKTLRARMLVNAAGPWVRGVLEQSNLESGAPGIRLVKGSHIIVPRFFDGDDAYILQQPDKRIVFAIPYEQDYTLIGTTDIEYHGDPAAVQIEPKEIAYLCAAVNRSFKHKTAPEDIRWTYSGVRPLLDDGDESASAVTRDYKLILDESHGPKLLSVFGGKLTTYRYLAQEALDTLTHKPAWTAAAPLPGGDIPDFDTFLAAKTSQYKDLPEPLIHRCAHSYGTRMDLFLSDNDLGEHFGDDLYEAEMHYLIEYEWAQTPDDILWRRTKQGLHVSAQTVQNLENFLKKK